VAARGELGEPRGAKVDSPEAQVRGRCRRLRLHRHNRVPICFGNLWLRSCRQFWPIPFRVYLQALQTSLSHNERISRDEALGCTHLIKIDFTLRWVWIVLAQRHEVLPEFWTANSEYSCWLDTRIRHAWVLRKCNDRGPPVAVTPCRVATRICRNTPRRHPNQDRSWPEINDCIVEIYLFLLNYYSVVIIINLPFG